MTRFLPFALLALLPLPATAQNVDCDNAQMQIEINFCAEQEWIAADEDLNAAYRGARAHMRTIDADLPANLRGAEVQLRDAQRAWVTFRDAACAAEGFALRGGTAEAMVIYFCLARLTLQRTADLETLTEPY